MLRLLLPVAGELGPALRLLVFGLTYFSHGLLWAAAAALLTQSRRMPASTNSSIWKMALFGPLLTTACSVAAWPALARQYGGTLLLLLPHLPGTSATPSNTLSAIGADSTASAYWLGEPFCRWIVVAWAAAWLLGFSRFIVAASALSRNIRHREPSANERSRHLLQGLLVRTRLTRVRLTESIRLTSPVSIGLGEVCVPKALLDTLSDAEVEAVLAHEVAHLERRDGIWFVAAAFVEAISGMYPPTRWVARRLRDSAELACDDRAVALTDQPRALAHALARVAERALALRGAGLLPSMADASGLLLKRVERLVSFDVAPARGRPVRGSGWALACVAVCGFSLSVIRLELPEGESSFVNAVLPAAESAAPALGPVAADPVSALALEIAGLEVRERELEATLDRLSSQSLLSSSGEPSPRRLELEQELRHSRAMREFLNARLGEPSGGTP